MPDNSLHEHHLFVFGDFRLDAGQRLLFRGRDVVPLEPKVFETLLALVEAAGRALTKEELLSRVWPDAFVEEGSLTRNISTLRKVLASDGNPQGYIDTLPRRGYRFQPVVERVSATSLPLSTAPLSAPLAATPPAVPSAALSVASPAGPPVMLEPAPAPVPATVAARPREARAGAPRFRWLTIAASTIVVLLGVAVAGAWWRSGDERERIRSIAVLPLQNLSGDSSQEFFSDGMTEALIARLAQVSDVRVTSRTSVMRFKGASAPVPDIGRELGVDAVVEGSVQREGSRVRVTVQLIHAATDSHLWAKEFDGTMQDVLDLQRRIALAIAGDISSKIAPVNPTGAPERRLSAEAVDAYLLGRYLHWKTDSRSQQQALVELRRAVALEPEYAEAQATLAMALVGRPGGEALQVARKAVALDDHHAEAHAALAAALFEEWDREGTQREFERALALYPNSEDACANYGLALSAWGRHDEAVAWSGRFASRNPVSAALHLNYAIVLINARRFAEAERHVKLALELEPQSFGAPLVLAQVYSLTNRREQALALLSKPPFAGSSMHAGMYAALGRRDEALAIVRTIEPKPSPVDLYAIANVYLLLGDTDLGFEWMGRAVAKRASYVRWMNVHPAFDPWRNDPRFIALIQQLRLPTTTGS